MDEPKDRLRKARIAAGFDTEADAARQHGWKVGSYRHHENGTRGISPEVADEYARAFHVSAGWLLCLPEAQERMPEAQVEDIEVIGEAALGVWREATVEELQQQRQKMIGVPSIVAKRKGERRFCVRVGDASINKDFPIGSYAICVALKKMNYEAHDFSVGDVLYIERNRRGLKELSLRRVSVINGEKMRLSTHSTDPKFRQELAYPSASSNVETITLLGKVVGRYADFPIA